MPIENPRHVRPAGAMRTWHPASIILAYMIQAAATAAAIGCASRFISGMASDIALQEAICLAKRCNKGGTITEKALSCASTINTCDAAISGMMGCILNVAMPGIGMLGAGIAAMARNLSGTLIKKTILKMLINTTIGKYLKSYCDD